jgi:GT2 family glycosyltransferase
VASGRIFESGARVQSSREPPVLPPDRQCGYWIRGRRALCFRAIRLSHIIVTKGRPDPLREALESSIAASSADDEAVVVDGDPARSAQPVVEKLQADHPGANLRYLHSDPGMTLQRNVGIDAAQGDIVIFTDDDCTFAPNLFDDLVAVYDDQSIIGVTGQTIEDPLDRVGSEPHSRLRWLLLGGGRQGTMTRFGSRRPIVRVDQARDVEFMPGALMSARRQLAAEVRFDPQLTGYSLGEDDDFSYRLSRRGRVRYEPTLAVDHHIIGFRTMNQRERDRNQIINRVYLFRKNFSGSPRAKLGFLVLMVMMFVHRVVNREWNGLRGLIDGCFDVWRKREGPQTGLG